MATPIVRKMSSEEQWYVIKAECSGRQQRDREMSLASLPYFRPALRESLKSLRNIIHGIRSKLQLRCKAMELAVGPVPLRCSLSEWNEFFTTATDYCCGVYGREDIHYRGRGTKWVPSPPHIRNQLTSLLRFYEISLENNRDLIWQVISDRRRT